MPVKYHSKIIGRKGGVVRKLRTDYDVQIQVPSQDSEGKSENPVVILTGYEENCLNAKAAILDMVTQLVSCFCIALCKVVCLPIACSNFPVAKKQIGKLLFQ